MNLNLDTILAPCFSIRNENLIHPLSPLVRPAIFVAGAIPMYIFIILCIVFTEDDKKSFCSYYTNDSEDDFLDALLSILLCPRPSIYNSLVML